MEWGHPRFHDTGNKYIYSQSSQGENLVSAVFQEGVGKRKKKVKTKAQTTIIIVHWTVFMARSFLSFNQLFPQKQIQVTFLLLLSRIFYFG